MARGLNWDKLARNNRLNADYKPKKLRDRGQMNQPILAGWHSVPTEAVATVLMADTDSYKHQDPDDDGIPPWD